MLLSCYIIKNSLNVRSTWGEAFCHRAYVPTLQVFIFLFLRYICIHTYITIVQNLHSFHTRMSPCCQRLVRIVNKQVRSHNKKFVVSVWVPWKNRALEGRTGPKEETATGGRRNLYNGKLHDWCCMADIAMAITEWQWDWWDKIHALEKRKIHTKFVIGNPESNSHLGWARRVRRVKERQYEDLDLGTYKFYCIQITEGFASALQVPLHRMHRPLNSRVLQLFAKFILFVRSHLHLICHVARCCCTWATVVTLWNMCRQ